MFSSSWSILCDFRLLVQSTFQLYLYSHCLEDDRASLSMSNHRRAFFWCFLRRDLFCARKKSRNKIFFIFISISSIPLQDWLSKNSVWQTRHMIEISFLLRQNDVFFGVIYSARKKNLAMRCFPFQSFQSRCKVHTRRILCRRDTW